MPKRVKRRKVQTGKMKGKASRGNKLAYGDFGLRHLNVEDLIQDKLNLPVLL
jgi:ribosomal protein L16/L10AE